MLVAAYFVSDALVVEPWWIVGCSESVIIVIINDSIVQRLLEKLNLMHNIRNHQEYVACHRKPLKDRKML